MKRRLEIRYIADYEHYELWEIIYDPKDKLYPVQWSFFWEAHKNRKTIEWVAQKQFPHLYHFHL